MPNYEVSSSRFNPNRPPPPAYAEQNRSRIDTAPFVFPDIGPQFNPYQPPENSVFNRQPPASKLAADRGRFVTTPDYLDNPFGVSTTILGGYPGSGPTGGGGMFTGNESNFVGAIGVRNLLIRSIMDKLGRPSAFGTLGKLETSAGALENQLGLGRSDLASDAFGRAALEDLGHRSTLTDLLFKLYGQGADIYSTSRALTASERDRINAKHAKEEAETRDKVNQGLAVLAAATNTSQRSV